MTPTPSGFVNPTALSRCGLTLEDVQSWAEREKGKTYPKVVFANEVAPPEKVVCRSRKTRIRKMHKAGIGVRALSETFGIPQEEILQIL